MHRLGWKLAAQAGVTCRLRGLRPGGGAQGTTQEPHLKTSKRTKKSALRTLGLGKPLNVFSSAIAAPGGQEGGSTVGAEERRCRAQLCRRKMCNWRIIAGALAPAAL